MQNFKDETEGKLIRFANELGKELEIDELQFTRLGGFKYTQVGGPIDWDAAKKALGLDNWVYDDGFGCQEFDGFITFKGLDTWLQRKEYDGSEWWVWHKKPTLGD
mgnify:CR=1 FL=1